MKKIIYTVRVVETYAREHQVEAESMDEAFKILEEKYESGELDNTDTNYALKTDYTREMYEINARVK